MRGVGIRVRVRIRRPSSSLQDTEVSHRAFLKLYHPQLPNGHFSVSSFESADYRSAEAITPILTSIVNIAQVTSSNATTLPYPDPLVPSCAYCIYLAAIILITFGDNILQDADWPGKVQTLLQCLEIYGKRWTVASMHILFTISWI